MIQITTDWNERNTELLWKSAFKLKPKENERVEDALHLIWTRCQFENMYNRKCQDKIRIMDDKSRKAGNEAFKKMIETFKRWKQEISQSFMYLFNNGYKEAIKNTTKVNKQSLME